MGKQLHVAFLLFHPILKKALFYLRQNMGKKTQINKNTKKWSFFISFRTPPCQPWSQSKKSKTIAHTTACAIFINLCIINVSHSLTCAETSGKKP